MPLFARKIMCKKTYIGKTKIMINNLVDTATGSHYTLPGHSLADLELIVVEQTRYKNDLYRKEREEYNIRMYDTLHNSLNRKI